MQKLVHRMDTKQYRARTYAISLLIAALLQVPFAILFFVPRSGLGPGPGVLFFVPSIAFVTLFSPTSHNLALSVILCQTLLTAIPVFWLFTWRERPLSGTIIRLSCFIGLLVAGSALLIPFERTRAARRDAIRGSSHNAVLGSIQRLSNSLAFYRKKYGQFPEKLDQLDFPPAGSDVDSTHAGLVQFPLPMQDFFVFTYAPRRSLTGPYSSYEIHFDAKPGEWSDLYHYCSDETGLIHFNTTHDTCRNGFVVHANRD
jgi:hypothetical protein